MRTAILLARYAIWRARYVVFWVRQIVHVSALRALYRVERDFGAGRALAVRRAWRWHRWAIRRTWIAREGGR